VINQTIGFMTVHIKQQLMFNVLKKEGSLWKDKKGQNFDKHGIGNHY
jgi:hypothetical protein